MRHLNPEGWPRPKGYSNGILAEGRMVFVAGMIGWDTEGHFKDNIVDQFAQTLRNTVAVLETGGATASDIVRMTWYVKDLDAYRENLSGIGVAYRSIVGKHFPVMAVVGVNDLVEPDALIEIETTAVITVSS
ncbi:MAG: RidA family protein [Gammaproteobacteria bacterium]|nr:RidA family protein [Gammaproteobacteria bacterium]